MCLLIDANMMGLFLKPEDSDLQSVRKWKESGSGRLAYSEFGQIFEEFETHEGMTRKVSDYFARGRLKSVSPEKIGGLYTLINKWR